MDSVRSLLAVAVIIACSACRGHESQPQPPAGINTASERMHSEKTADVKTETAGSHFEHGMASPGAVMEAVRNTPHAAKPAMAGKVVGTAWKKCQSCHSFSSKTKVGPGLGKGGDIPGVFGRRAGAFPGYKYRFTRYIRGNAWVWDEVHLRKWICNSKEAVREFTGDSNARTKMPPQHLCNPGDQDSVLSKLKSVS